MRTEHPRTTDRAQAYTLEGFVGAMIVLMAVLFALQSIVITPTTGGSVDRTVQAQLQGEARDALTVAENDGDLSRLVRYWAPDDGVPDGDGGFHEADVPSSQRGTYSAERFADPDAMGGSLGEILDLRFAESGRNYNVELVYQDGAGSDSIDLVYQGRPSSNAFTASHTVALYDGQRLTAPGGEDYTLAEAADLADDAKYPVPDVDDGSALYNVVEVRVIVW